MSHPPLRREKPSPYRPFRLGPHMPPKISERAGPPRDGWELVLAGELSDQGGELHQKLADVSKYSSGIIYFDSCGGNAYIGLALATMIRLRGLKATGIVVGECSSAALLPFAACTMRYVTPHSALLFHPIRWQSGEQVRLEEAVEWARHFQFMEQDQDKLVGKLFGAAEDLIERWTRPGKFVTGPELVAAGLAHMLDLFAGSYWRQVGGR
jgi:ATP-dependent protease ClpP protease subunit